MRVEILLFLHAHVVRYLLLKQRRNVETWKHQGLVKNNRTEWFWKISSCRMRIRSGRAREKFTPYCAKKEKKKRKTLLNIIEETCCINDFSRCLFAPLLLFNLYYSTSVKGSNSDNTEFVDEIAKILWKISCVDELLLQHQKVCRSCLRVHEVCKFDHGRILFLMDF